MAEYARIDKQTDKAETKVCPCTYPECENAVEVNRFYAPAKARCDDHKGQTSSSVRAAVAKIGATPSAEAEPNRALAGLRCPFDDELLDLMKVEEVGSTDVFLTFGCDKCKAAIKIMPQWKGLIMKAIPEEWKVIVGQLKARKKEVASA